MLGSKVDIYSMSCWLCVKPTSLINGDDACDNYKLRINREIIWSFLAIEIVRLYGSIYVMSTKNEVNLTKIKCTSLRKLSQCFLEKHSSGTQSRFFPVWFCWLGLEVLDLIFSDSRYGLAWASTLGVLVGWVVLVALEVVAWLLVFASIGIQLLYMIEQCCFGVAGMQNDD